MLESMEELADAIEDAQYVNAIATQEDGPKPVIPWEQPTPIELHGWEQRMIQKQQQYNQRIHIKFQQKSLSYCTKLIDIEAFSMEWVCQQPIGFYLFSEYIKVVCDDYVRINFMEQIIRFRKLISPLSTTTTSRSSSISNNNKIMEDRLLFAIQLIQQFIGYSQLPEMKIISPSPAPPIAVPTSTTTTIPVDSNSSDVLLVSSESLPKPEDPPTKDQRVSSSTDVLQPEQQHSPNAPLTENTKGPIVQYIWNTLPPRTEIDEYDLARPTMEYYYFNHPSNSTNNQNKTNPPSQSTTTEKMITAETNVDCTNMSSIPKTPSTDPCRTPKHVIEMSNEELRLLVHENCDYPICSMSIVGLKGPVLDHMIQLLASNISMVQKVTMLSSTMQQQQQPHRRSSATKSEYRSSSEFYTHPSPPYLDQPDANHRSFSKLNDSYGSLSHNSSERTHYRNIPAEEVFEALDSSLMTSSQTHRQSSQNNIRRQSSSGGGGNSGNQKSSVRHQSFSDTATNNNHELLMNGAPMTERTAAMTTAASVTTNTTSNGNSSTIVQELRQPQDVLTTSNNNSTIGNNSSSSVVDVPIHFFDVAEYIIMESLKEQYWIPFTKSSYYTKCKHFLWYQDRKIIPDDFYILRVLGRGGFGLVTACKKGTSGKLYAMKVMNKRRIKMKRSESLALNERNALAAVESNFVINLKYAFQSSEDIYFILDLMTGGDLGYHLHQRRRFPKRECLYYAARIMLGLQALHDKGYVFRDVKPENCLLADDGRVKITDLGLATKITPTLNGAAGTRGYWAPEMLRRDSDGKRLTYDHSVDWFSFGCCVAEFISGTNPFRSEAAITFGKERGKATKEKMIDCATLDMNPEFKSEFFESDAADLCRRLLDKNPTTRLGRSGCEEIMAHSWFKSLNWDSIISDRKRPPFIPPRDVNAASQSQIGNFAEDRVYHETVMTPEDEKRYKDLDWTNPRAFAAEVIEFWIYERVTGEPLVPMSHNNGCCCVVS